MTESIQYFGSSTSRHRELMRGVGKALRLEIHDHWGGLEAARRAAARGMGSVWLFSHNMINDGIAMISELRSDPAFADIDLLVPMSSELFYEKKYRIFQKPLRTRFIPIVTPEVRVTKKLKPGHPTGLGTYFREARILLSRGGMVAFAPQAQGNLGALDLSNPTRAFSLFMKAMSMSSDVSHAPDFVVVPVGMSVPFAAEKGKSQKGVHMGRKIRVDIGRCVPRDQVMAELPEFDGNADKWAYSAIASLLPLVAVKRFADK